MQNEKYPNSIWKTKESYLDSAFKTGKHNVDKKELQKLLNQKLK